MTPNFAPVDSGDSGSAREQIKVFTMFHQYSLLHYVVRYNAYTVHMRYLVGGSVSLLSAFGLRL